MDNLGLFAWGLWFGWLAGLFTGVFIFKSAMKTVRFGLKAPPGKIIRPESFETRAAEDIKAIDREYTKDTLRRGADELQAIAKEQNLPLSRKDAENQVKEMLASAGRGDAMG